jgi:transposase
MKYLFLKENTVKKNNDDISVTLSDICPSCSTVKNWVDTFRKGYLSTEEEERCGRPTQGTIPVKEYAINSLIMDDRRISARKIEQNLAISRERVGSIIHEILDMRKPSAKWVPKCLNADQKRD